MKRPSAALATLLLVALAALGAALGWPARASADTASPWYVTEQGRVRLIAAMADPGDTASVSLGLQFELAPHWKIYWRSPGDAGSRRRSIWTGSTNLADTTIAWPAPERFSVLGVETAGYTGAVVLPITARLRAAGAAAASQGASLLSHVHRNLRAA